MQQNFKPDEPEEPKHKRKVRKKTYKIEWLTPFSNEWSTWKRYETEDQMKEAFDKLNQKSVDLFRYRVA